MLTLLTAAFASPPTVQVTYVVRFDVDATGDQICSFTKLCDCTSTYVGTGNLVKETSDRLTFEGTWQRTANTCSDPLLVWDAGEGKAYHTLRHRNGRVTEWVAHRDAERYERLTSDMKAGGQFWMDAIDQPWPAASVTSTQRDGTTLAGAVKLDATHMLEITFPSGDQKTSP
ncbi:MAG: hypothetical protein KC656_04480 [Myxococcales bacterium]|nr:hypothetical protein [Myxococcales bacterium]MCB9668856.1 hypothetical protein [Alphaproteobacteria bacterium]MCB9691182.1 hypothetical protein [Alphaproteobacteria bacterium]